MNSLAKPDLACAERVWCQIHIHLGYLLSIHKYIYTHSKILGLQFKLQEGMQS